VDYVIATTTSFFNIGGQTLFVPAGERWARSSDLVKQYPGSFADPDEGDIRGVVESATSAPGEKRATVRSK
jgi:hypothetical protein